MSSCIVRGLITTLVVRGIGGGGGLKRRERADGGQVGRLVSLKPLKPQTIKLLLRGDKLK